MFKYKKQLISLMFLLTANLNAAQYYEIQSSNLNQVFSSTFDGLVFSKQVTNDGSFFGNVPDINNPIFGLNRSTIWEKTGNFDGAGFITFDQNEPEAFFIQLPDIDVSIITSYSHTMDISTSGLYLTANNLPSPGGYDSNYDVGGPLTNNNIEIVADFSVFNNVTAGESGVITSCTSLDGFCPLAPALSLDLVRFTLEGTPTENGGDNFILRGQTSNYSYLEIEFTTAAVPLPAGIYLFLSGLVGLVGVKLRGRNG